MTNTDHIKLDDGVYEEVPRMANAASRIIADMYENLGKPETPLSTSGEKMMGIIISVWEDMYGDEVKQWRETRKEYQKEELTTGEQIRGETGGSLASIPTPIYQMMRKVFPTYKLSSRDDWIKFLERYPMFSMSQSRKPRAKSPTIIT